MDAEANPGSTAQHAEYTPTDRDGGRPDQKSAGKVKGKLISTNFAVMVAGMNDAAVGVLIPYLQPSYGITLLQVSFIYLINFAGWLFGSFANIHICARTGTGGTMVLGASVQCIGYALMFWKPPFPIFLSAFFFTGIGVSLQDAQANSFTITVQNCHRWLGILHAVYGVGTILAPLVANTIAARTPAWNVYYLVTLVLGVTNVSLLAWTFRRGLFQPNVANAKELAGGQLRETVSNKAVWIMNGFFFLYVGAEVTSGGWLSQFLISVRHGDPKQVGYIASVYWAGFTAGRVVLADITHQLGERRMVFLYIVLALVMQVLFWLVPNILANAITICLFGFIIGPFYPVGLYVLTEVIPPDLHIGALGFCASLGSAGSAAFPFLTGAIASQVGVQVLPPIIMGLVIGMGVFWAMMPKRLMI